MKTSRKILIAIILLNLTIWLFIESFKLVPLDFFLRLLGSSLSFFVVWGSSWLFIYFFLAQYTLEIIKLHNSILIDNDEIDGKSVYDGNILYSRNEKFAKIGFKFIDIFFITLFIFDFILIINFSTSIFFDWGLGYIYRLL